MARAKWLEEDTDKERSIKQEKKLAKEFKGMRTLNSGALFQKNDVWAKRFSIEAKTTKKNSYSTNILDLQKMCEHAATQSKIALFLVEFDKRDSYVTMHITDFKLLFDELI